MSAEKKKRYQESFGKGDSDWELYRECSSSRHCVQMAVCSPGLQLTEIPQQWKLQGIDESRRETWSVLQRKEDVGEEAQG